MYFTPREVYNKTAMILKKLPELGPGLRLYNQLRNMQERYGIGKVRNVTRYVMDSKERRKTKIEKVAKVLKEKGAVIKS